MPSISQWLFYVYCTFFWTPSSSGLEQIVAYMCTYIHDDKLETISPTSVTSCRIIRGAKFLEEILVINLKPIQLIENSKPNIAYSHYAGSIKPAT